MTDTTKKTSVNVEPRKVNLGNAADDNLGNPFNNLGHGFLSEASLTENDIAIWTQGKYEWGLVEAVLLVHGIPPYKKVLYNTTGKSSASFAEIVECSVSNYSHSEDVLIKIYEALDDAIGVYNHTNCKFKILDSSNIIPELFLVWAKENQIGKVQQIDALMAALEQAKSQTNKDSMVTSPEATELPQTNLKAPAKDGVPKKKVGRPLGTYKKEDAELARTIYKMKKEGNLTIKKIAQELKMSDKKAYTLKRRIDKQDERKIGKENDTSV